MVVRHLIKKQTYFDSVTLMLIGTQVKKMEGVDNVVVGMGTDYNIDSLKRLDMFLPEFKEITPNDLIICVRGNDEAGADKGMAEVQNLLSSKKKTGETQELAPTSFAAANNRMPDSNIVQISIPGEYAAREANKALDAGKHVMLFSDNVSIEEELKLKQKGVEKGLLVMGPDCGTAIINNTPLAFSNVVRRGDIGIVAASGTGLQEVSSTIHRLGCGITQAIGVGGRDLKEEIGGLMTIMATKALAEDPDTKVIVLISKPPAESVLKKLYTEISGYSNKIIIYFIGADQKEIESHGFTAAKNLEDAAIKAAGRSLNTTLEPEFAESLVADIASRVKMPAKNFRGLYSGGTLCDEAQRVLQPLVGDIYSNTPVKGCKKLEDSYKSQENTIIDLGDDQFTRGRAHPMIDPDYRIERIIQESADPNVGLIFFDVVLGYGANEDMATQMMYAIQEARVKTEREPVYAACICGTQDDPQGYDNQKKILEEAGVHVFPTNIALANFVKYSLEGVK